MNGYQCPNISTCSCGHAQKGLICSKFPLIFQKYLPCRSLADRYNGIAEGKNDHFRTQFLYMFLNLKSAILLLNKDNTLGYQAFMDMWLMPALLSRVSLQQMKQALPESKKLTLQWGLCCLVKDKTSFEPFSWQRGTSRRGFQHLYSYLPAKDSTGNFILFLNYSREFWQGLSTGASLHNPCTMMLSRKNADLDQDNTPAKTGESHTYPLNH